MTHFDGAFYWIQCFKWTPYNFDLVQVPGFSLLLSIFSFNFEICLQLLPFVNWEQELSFIQLLLSMTRWKLNLFHLFSSSNWNPTTRSYSRRVKFHTRSRKLQRLESWKSFREEEVMTIFLWIQIERSLIDSRKL